MTVYLQSFRTPSYAYECSFFAGQGMTCYGSEYPFGVFGENRLPELRFEPITFFCGGNGSGKTTLINVIAGAVHAVRGAACNRSRFFDDYVAGCEPRWRRGTSWQDAEILTSDDVFDYIFDIRAMNEGIDRARERVLDEHAALRHKRFRMKSLDDYEELKQMNEARRRTASEYVRRSVMRDIPEKSNGQSALMFFSGKITENKLYLLDEPENSMSAEYQMELLGFIEDSARFFNCQFIIATHSPILMAAKDARIYDLDSDPVCERRWADMPDVKRYYEFFRQREKEFL